MQKPLASLLFASFTLILGGCIKSEQPIISSDGSASSIVRAGYYEECQYSYNQNGSRNNSSCQIVKMDFLPGHVLAVEQADGGALSLVAVRNLGADRYIVQTGDAKSGFKSGFRYAIAKTANNADRLTIDYPDCRLSSELAEIVSWQGYRADWARQDSPSCSVDNLTEADLVAIFDSISRLRRGWRPSYSVEIRWIPQADGAKKFEALAKKR